MKNWFSFHSLIPQLFDFTTYLIVQHTFSILTSYVMFVYDFILPLLILYFCIINRLHNLSTKFTTCRLLQTKPENLQNEKYVNSFNDVFLLLLFTSFFLTFSHLLLLALLLHSKLFP